MTERFKILKYSVLDLKTGLEWQKDAGGRMSWDEAMEYASSLRLGKHSDWRVPTIEELLTLIDFAKTGPASSFPAMPSHWFWSSSSYSGSSSNAWLVSVNFGSVSNDVKTNSFNVRCIRRGPLVLGPWVSDDQEPRTGREPGSYEELAAGIGRLVEEKQKAYGDSFGRSGEILKILYPDGVRPDEYGNVLAVTRIVDKLFRIANQPDAFQESPGRDIAGYGLLIAKSQERKEK
jgi:hypothetical protein